MKVPYLSLKNINKSILENYQNKLLSEIKNGKYILNRNVIEFENKFAKYFKSKYCVSVNSGHDALKIALLSLKLKKNDKVIVPSQTFISTWFAVNEIGAKIIPVDIDLNSGLICNKKILKEISNNKIKCVIFVHLYGNLCNISEIKSVLKRKKISILEDCSQSHGGFFNKKFSGTFGDVATFSFYPGKNLGGIGDGGAILTNSKSVKDLSLKLRNYGSIKKYYHNKIGFNSRLNSINAKFLYYKLDHLKSEIRIRDKKYLIYKKILKNS